MSGFLPRKTIKVSTRLLTTSSTLALVACGGGGGGGGSFSLSLGSGGATSSRLSLASRIVDGYVADAEVFPDFDFDGFMDADEAQGILHASNLVATSFQLHTAIAASYQLCRGLRVKV